VSSRRVEPVAGALDAEVAVPGSKSITNRVLLIAALAQGTTAIDGVLFADDTEAMLDAVTRLGARVRVDRGHERVSIDGVAGVVQAGEFDVRQSGTTARFITPVVSLAPGRSLVDGHPQMLTRSWPRSNSSA
jgi:3-phosphoshikimate 1-carboxyvinyltransferase